jgi:hypothetical protein
MSLGKDKMFAQSSFRNAVSAARELFVSHEFRAVLDGAFAEEYGPLSKSLSVNNDCLPKHDECTRELQERHVTDAQLLEADQQLPEPIQPGEGALDHPPPGAALRRASAGGGVA